MSERKNIETFFQEQFNNFEVAPPENSWNAIEEKLNEKKKRRIIPFWWKFSGVAALLLLGLFYFNSTKNLINPNENNSNKSTVEISNNNTTQNQSEIKNQTKIVSTEIKNESENNVAKSINNSENSIKNNKLTSSLVLPKVTAFSDNSYQKSQLGSNSEKKFVTKNDDKNTIENTVFQDLNNTEISKNTISEKINTNSTVSNFEKNKDANELIKKDSTKMAVVEPNSMEELLKEKEKKIIAEQKLNRWQVMPTIAPVYFSSITNGSPLDVKLISNNKTYNTSMSYGVNVNYAINKKLKLRTGLSAVVLDYNTDGILFYQNSAASKMAHLNPNTQGQTIQIEPLQNVTTSLNRISDSSQEGVINQKMGYIEMPLEMSYKVINKKIGVEIVGGMSSLFLNQNDIYLKSNNLNMKIGEANNLNAVHFSSNIGLGINYGILKNLDARIEPVLKYQINTFNTDSGNFKPYFLGIYSGISFSF